MKNTMLQEVMTAPGKIIFREIPIPKPDDNQVLVKIMKIGICGSDIHVYHGTHPYTSYPVTQGHEVSAKIVCLGKNVTNFKEGDMVTIEPQVFCGHCYTCTHDHYYACSDLKVMGFQTTGTASEYFAVDASKVDLAPSGLTYTDTAMIEPLAVTVHAAKRENVKGKNIAVLGVGPIGNLLMQSLKAEGAAKVMVTDVSDFRLELAKKCGADFIYNTKKIDFGDAMIDAFGENKADLIYDCAGNDITMNSAIRNARKCTTIVLVAVFGKMANVDLAKLNDSELTLNTSFMYSHEDYVDAMKFVSEGKIQLKPLQSKHFPFKEFLNAYKYIDDNREKTMKVIVDVDETEE